MRANETNSAKDEIFASIRRNLAASAPFDAVRKEHDHHGEPVRKDNIVSEGSAKSLIDRFRENLESVGGKCALVHNDEEAGKVIQGIIDDVNPARIAFSDSPMANPIRGSIRSDAEIIDNASADTLFDCEVGVTSAQWAIAETGTLVLESEREFSRLTSLVPPIHVCILDAVNIRATLGEILNTVKNDLNPTVTFITGPSRTSDIELTLAIGVHGPRELHVIVISSSQRGIEPA